MPAERAGYTVTMFLIDISPTMAKMRIVKQPDVLNGEKTFTEITNLEWAMQFIKLKVQEMIYNGRKTDQFGVILCGSEETDNIVNEKNGGYENISEYIHIGQANAGTIAKLDALQPSSVIGDPVDALIVGIETQNVYLANKKTWTRKIVLITDGENPIEIEDWEATVQKMDALDVSLTVVGVDFDDEEFPFQEENKSQIKTANETFYQTLTSALANGVMGTCALALRETTRPDIKQTKSVLMGSVLRLGDVDMRPDEAVEVLIKTSKCTALARPKSWKKFGKRERGEDGMDVDEENDEDAKVAFAQLQMRTEYYIDRSEEREDEDEVEDEMDVNDDVPGKKDENLEKVEKEQLVRGFKYGTTYAPCPDGQFPRLNTVKGIDICGFFQAKNFRRELSMGEIQYVWADPTQPQQQVALSSIVRAMYEKDVMAIARWVTKDGMDPKMGVLAPSVFEKVDCLLWAQMPFADDVRKYTFASLDKLVSKKGEVKDHPSIPTANQLNAMDNFVDAMDLMHAGEKDETGERGQWHDTRLSYNPAIHRTKQALFHCAVVSDLEANPIPPPHPELLKYFEPPKRVLKHALDAIEECKEIFKVKEVPKKVTKGRKDGHVRAQDDDDEMLLLDRKLPKITQSQMVAESSASGPAKNKNKAGSDNASEGEEEESLLDAKAKPAPGKPRGIPLPTPARSLSPPIDPGRAPGRIIGTTYPLEDFQKNIAKGDVVSKAVEDLGAVIQEIAVKPFASRRFGELVECMKTFRDVALKEDEIDAWNGFLTELHKTCMSNPGNRAFWAEVQKVGRSMSLISNKEAEKYGGISAISESKAAKFVDG